MYLEDLIREVVHPNRAYRLESDDFIYLTSIDEQIKSGKVLTTRQTYAARKRLRPYSDRTAVFTPMLSREAFEAAIDDNLWRNSPRVVTEKRTEARYLGDNLVGLSYTTNAVMNTMMAPLKSRYRDGLQIVSVTGANLDMLVELLGSARFEIDDALEEYLALCMSSQLGDSHLIHEGDMVVCNICDSDTVSQFLLHVVGAELI